MARLSLSVKPGSKAPGLERFEETYVLRVRERAIDGAANAACIRDLAERLRLRPAQIALLHGERSRRKVFEIDGIDDDALAELLNRAVEDNSEGTRR